jgi:hypothetical protein
VQATLAQFAFATLLEGSPTRTLYLALSNQFNGALMSFSS